MYLISWNEADGRIEASLGGRVPLDEMQVFTQDLEQFIEDLDGQPYTVLLDYSRSRPFDRECRQSLAAFQEWALEQGCVKWVNVVRDAEEQADIVTRRFAAVMDGTEDYVLEPDGATWPEFRREVSAVRIAA
ncbi:MAG: hypothetical protein SNJ74_12925 [Fimbriimonadaceae bacterium]